MLLRHRLDHDGHRYATEAQAEHDAGVMPHQGRDCRGPPDGVAHQPACGLGTWSCRAAGVAGFPLALRTQLER